MPRKGKLKERIMTDLEKAKLELAENNIALQKGYISLVSSKKGVEPIMGFGALGIDLEGFSVATKIVGRAEAFLFIKAKISNLYAKILSKKAKKVLDKYKIEYTYDTLCDYVTTQKGDGKCPMETAVESEENVEKACEIIVEKYAQQSGR